MAILYSTYSALFGSTSVVFAKLLAEFLVLNFSGVEVFTHWLFYATLLALLTIHAAVAEGTQAQAGGVGQRQQPAAAALTTAAYDVAGEAISIGEMRRRLTEASPTTRSRDFLN